MSASPESATSQPTRQRDRISFGSWLINVTGALVGVALLLAVATVPLTPRGQTILAVAAAVVFLVVNRFKSQGVTMFLIMLSLAMSLRYIFWRITETLQFATWLELFLGAGLAVAEVYAVTVLVLGYVQTIWPLQRKPLPLPQDPATWPTVDIFIPTYNEQMSVVRATVLAAMAIDWPRDKMQVFILDDGRREEFRRFAESCGCGYITRTSNVHAKAGNLNHALAQTNGEYVAVFDCDHIPTRAFLQLTMGWMFAQSNMAMVQTPHHFYSPDPFQRNLQAGIRVPAEGNMFYGLVQDGNDYWNACFFCGSCAVLRRAALLDVGGFAVETVTEDAHTMLRMHRRGWDSAYLRLPLAAGLATERLALHIGQRIRWARGMIQILRIDNPLFGRGLTLAQRICYLQACGHFLFAIPRVVFLTAPLAYLLAGLNVIAASPLAITAYALPHLFLAVATNSRMQKNWRHSFWSEIYETVLALFLVRVTLATLASPRRGKFNVTAKGGLLENGYFDLRAVYPNLVLCGLLIAGLIRGVISLVFFRQQMVTTQALWLNAIWATFSLLAVLAALAVGREARQVRSRARISAELPTTVRLPDGTVYTGNSRDLSQSGAGLFMEGKCDIPDGCPVAVEVMLGNETVSVPAEVVRLEGQVLQIRWSPATLQEEANVIRVVFGRADSWLDWANYPIDHPLVSLWHVLVSIRGLFRPREPAMVTTAGSGAGPGPGERGEPRAEGRVRMATATAAAVLGLLLLASVAALAQTAPRAVPTPLGTGSTTVVRPVPPPSSPFTVPLAMPSPQPAQPTQAVPPPPASVVAAPGPAPVAPVPAPAAVAQPPVDQTPRAGVRTVVFSLKYLGAQGPMTLRGTSELQGLEFGIRADEVVTAAQLSLNGAMSPALIPEFSNITVTLNEQYVGTIPVTPDHPPYQVQMPINPVFFQDNNRLNFRFIGRYVRDCNDPLSGLLWAIISDTSTLTMTLERLPPQRELARLPLPFFDGHEKERLNLPFILTAAPGDAGLKAAGIVASWFGHHAAYRGATFPVLTQAPAEGNAVMIVSGAEVRDNAVGLPEITGPTLAVLANPNDPLSSILLVAGRNGDETVAAATALVVGSRALATSVAQVQQPTLPARVPYDAPGWIATDRAVRFGELTDAGNLQSVGYVGLLRVPFRTAPDLYTWRDKPFPMKLRVHAPPGPIIDVLPSRLDIGINSLYLQSLSLALADPQLQPGLLDRWLGVFWLRLPPQTVVGVPTYDVFGQNDLQFFFDARPLARGSCVAVPNDLRMSVDPTSTFDLSSAYRISRMPNLAYFVSAAFPFTKYADLSHTAVVLTDRPSGVEISAFLDLMGRIGSITDYPVIGMTVVRPGAVASVADRDLLVIGTLSGNDGIGALLATAPVHLEDGRLAVTIPRPLSSVWRLFGDPTEAERTRVGATLAAGLTDDWAALIGAESPQQRGRSLVALVAGSPQSLDALVGSLRNPGQTPLIQGDLTLYTGGRPSSYRVGDTYTVGTVPIWLWPSWYFTNQPYAVFLLVLLGCFLLGFPLYWLVRRRADRRLPRERTKAQP
jgi:cellulose synthase (UDP-forming)